jgi:surface protein
MILTLIFLNISKTNILKESFIKLKSNEINIKIQGIGEQYILYYEYVYCPNKIYLNGKQINMIDCHIINIPSQEGNEDEVNNITLIWDNSLTDTSYMFSYCYSLISIDLSNFDTSKVNNMKDMFFDSYLLTSLNLSSFDTSNVKDMKRMFYNCSSLISLDLSNFDTSNVNDMSYMFYGCANLQYINFESYNELENLVIDNILSFVPQNIVICLNKNNSISKIMEKISEKDCFNIYCGYDWQSHQKIFGESNYCYLPEEKNGEIYKEINNIMKKI